jgi:hypothetical protein
VTPARRYVPILLASDAAHGHDVGVTRDLAWAAICEVADRLNRRVSDSTLEVRAVRRRSSLQWTVTEGIEVVDNWTELFEPVRRRRLMPSTWEEIQPVQQAASNVGSFLRDRPDLA